MNNVEKLRQIIAIDEEIAVCYEKIAAIDEEMLRLRAEMDEIDDLKEKIYKEDSDG